MNKLRSTSQKQYTYSESLAQSLVNFATAHTDFAQLLACMIPEGGAGISDVTYTIEKNPLFKLQTEQQAVQRASWLLYMTAHGYIGKNDGTLTILSSWAKGFEREEPKAIILGLKYGIEPFGIWGEPNRKKHPVNILLCEKTVRSISKGALSQEVVKLTQTLVTKGLLQANGNTRRLEPELSDWLFGEKLVNLYKTSTQNMEKVLTLLKEYDAPHVAQYSEKNTLVYLAIGPTVYLEDTGYENLLEKIS